jgi:hypothetical protein
VKKPKKLCTCYQLNIKIILIYIYFRHNLISFLIEFMIMGRMYNNIGNNSINNKKGLRDLYIINLAEQKIIYIEKSCLYNQK